MLLEYSRVPKSSKIEFNSFKQISYRTVLALLCFCFSFTFQLFLYDLNHTLLVFWVLPPMLH